MPLISSPPCQPKRKQEKVRCKEKAGAEKESRGEEKVRRRQKSDAEKVRSETESEGPRKSTARKPAKATRRTGARGKQDVTETLVAPRGRGLGSSSGGQSGDTQGLSLREEADSESVTELEEEGQYFEAEAVRGVENAPDADQGEVRTHEVPEDDVQEEYRDEKETDTD